MVWAMRMQHVVQGGTTTSTGGQAQTGAQPQSQPPSQLGSTQSLAAPPEVGVCVCALCIVYCVCVCTQGLGARL